MAEAEQVNVRIPKGAKPAIMRLARLLRQDENFVHRLGRFLDEDQDTDLGALLSQRIDRLERRLAALEVGAPAPTDAGRSPPEIAPKPPAEPVWTTGEGRGRRLTEEGERELQRLVSEGLGDSAIAGRLGVKPFTVSARRKKPHEKQ